MLHILFYELINILMLVGYYVNPISQHLSTGSHPSAKFWPYQPTQISKLKLSQARLT